MLKRIPFGYNGVCDVPKSFGYNGNGVRCGQVDAELMREFTFVNKPTMNACSIPLKIVNGTNKSGFGFVRFLSIVVIISNENSGAFFLKNYD